MFFIFLRNVLAERKTGAGLAAVHALSIVFAAWGVGTIGGALAYWGDAGSTIRTAAIGILIATCALFTAAAALATVGLNETRADRLPKPRRGRDEASAAMTLSLVCIAATSWGLARSWPAPLANDAAPDERSTLVETRRPTLPATVDSGSSTTTSPPTGAPRYDAYASPFARVAPVSKGEGSSWSGWLQNSSDTAADAGPALLEFPALNFRFHRPDRGFLRLDPQIVNPAATAAYRNPLTNCEFIVIAEALGIETSTTSADVALSAKRNLSAVAPDVVFEDERERRLHWISGRMFSASGQARNGRFHSVYWTAASNGYCYQLIFTSPISTTTPPNLEHLLQCFEPIDADLQAHTSTFASPAGSSRDSDLGFSMSLRGTPWRAWPGLGNEFPAAAFAARLDPQTGFLAVPVRLCGLPAEHEALGTALCVLVGRSYVGSAGGNPATVRSCKVEHLDDVTRPLIVETRYAVDRALLSTEDAFVGTVPSPSECLWLRREPIERRRRPLYFEFPLEIDATTTITPPGVRAFTPVERLDQVGEAEMLDRRVDASLVAGALRLHCTVGRRPGSYPPQAYAAFCDAAEQCDGTISPTLVLRPTGGR